MHQKLLAVSCSGGTKTAMRKAGTSLIVSRTIGRHRLWRGRGSAVGFNALLDESHAELEKWYRPRKDIKGSPTSSVTAASPKESRFQVMVKSQEWDSVNAYFHHSEEDEYHKEEDENNKSEK